MRKKLLFLPIVLLGLVLSGCGSSNLKDNFTEADQTVDTPWSDFVLPATGISFAAGEESISLKKGETHAYQYEIQPRGATVNSLTWYSHDESVATVADGVVTAVGGGQTKIAASSPDNTFDPVELDVDVIVPLEDFSLSIPEKLAWEEQYTFDVTYVPVDSTETGLVYELSDVSPEGVVSLNQGVITTGKQNGTAKLKVTGGANIVKEYTLNVNSVAITSITIADVGHELEVDHTLELKATVLPENAVDIAKKGVKYYSKNPEIATVNETTGVVLGVAPGTAQIYAKCGDFVSADYAVTVYKVNVTAVDITTPDFTLSNASEDSLTKQLEYTLTTDHAKQEASDATVSFASSNERVATVSDSGLVTATGPGTAEISVKVAQPGLDVIQDSVNVTVNIVSKTLTITGGNSFYNDSTLTLSAVLTPATVSNNEINWTLEQSPEIVSLSANKGASVTLTPINNEVTGTVKVKATNTGGASNEVTVTLMERAAEFTAGHHYIVGSAAYNTGESVQGKASWNDAKYAYHFTYNVPDPNVYEQFKGTIKFQAGDQFKYFIGADYWVPAWEQHEGWAEKGWHIDPAGAFAAGQMRYVKENDNHEFVVSEDPDANIEVVEAGYYDLYAKLYKNEDESLWYSLYIQKVPTLSVEAESITMGLEDAYQIKAHDWIGTVTYTIKSGGEYITLSPTGLVTGKGTAGTAVVTVNDDRNVPVDVTITLQANAPQINRTVYLNANGMFDVANVVPFIHSWGEGDGNYANTKMNKVEGQNIVYSASIPLDHSSLLFARCPEGATDLVWDEIYNQSKNQAIPTDGKDMFTMTSWLEETDDHHRTFLDGEWSTFDSSIVYTAQGSNPGSEGDDINGDCYLMYGNDPSWNFLPLTENQGNPSELMAELDLEANTEFVIKMAEDDWRHFENNKDASSDKVIQGSASNLEETEHNFKASETGTYSFYILKDKEAEGGKTVYVGFAPKGDTPVVPTTYTVSFNANGGTGTKAAVEGVSGEYTLPDASGLTAPEGYSFAGWAYTADGQVIASATINVATDITLFAIWQEEQQQQDPNNVTLYLTANWGGWESPKAYVFNNSTQAPKVAWPGENMTYVGVNDDNDTIFSYTVDINQYDRIIFSNGGEGDANQTVDIDISAAKNNDAFYLSGRVEGDNSKITVGTWTFDINTALTSKNIIYFTNNKEWSDVKFYVFDSSNTNDAPVAWPGVAAKWVFKNGDNQDVYRLLIDTSLYDSFIFNGSGGQSIDIALSSLTDDNNAFYLTDQNGSGNYEVGQWKYNPLG